MSSTWGGGRPVARCEHRTAWAAGPYSPAGGDGPRGLSPGLAMSLFVPFLRPSKFLASAASQGLRGMGFPSASHMALLRFRCGPSRLPPAIRVEASQRPLLVPKPVSDTHYLMLAPPKGRGLFWFTLCSCSVWRWLAPGQCARQRGNNLGCGGGNRDGS